MKLTDIVLSPIYSEISPSAVELDLEVSILKQFGKEEFLTIIKTKKGKTHIILSTPISLTAWENIIFSKQAKSLPAP